MGEIIPLKCDQWLVRVFDPKTGKLVDQTIAMSEGEAWRFAAFCNRTYIIGKMTAWLEQRWHAYREPQFIYQRAKCEQLLAEILHLSQASLYVIKAKIAAHENLIELIAPKPKSAQYPYYESVIRSIVEFCKETEAVDA